MHLQSFEGCIQKFKGKSKVLLKQKPRGLLVAVESQNQTNH